MLAENKRILIVDDEPSIRKLFQKILSDPANTNVVLSQGAALFGNSAETSAPEKIERYDLTMADCGKAAIQAVETATSEGDPFAVAFMDEGLPGMDGIQAAISIWNIDPNIKIVFATGSINFDLEEVRRTTGKKDIYHLQKPFGPKRVLELVKKLAESSA